LFPATLKNTATTWPSLALGAITSHFRSVSCELFAFYCLTLTCAQAAADKYGLQITLITSYKDAPIIDILPRVVRSSRILYVSFFGELHYNSLYSLEGTALSPLFQNVQTICADITRRKKLDGIYSAEDCVLF
jgi:hypothetical protein